MGIVLTRDDVVYAINEPTLKAIFDDDNDGQIDWRAVEAVIARAEEMVWSFLRPVFRYMFDIESTGIPALVKFAALDFFVAFAFERHPEYTKGYGERQRGDRYARAIQTMKNIQGAVQQVYAANEAGEVPLTVQGGILYESGPRTMTRGPDGFDNGSGF